MFNYSCLHFLLNLTLTLKSPLKGKRFETIDESQENTVGQVMVTGRTAQGPKVPTLKGTEVSLSYAQCFLHLACSSINVSFSYYMAGYLLDRPHSFYQVKKLKGKKYGSYVNNLRNIMLPWLVWLIRLEYQGMCLSWAFDPQSRSL